MKEERPLRVSGSEAERLLLAAAFSEKPDPDSMRRAARRLGLSPGPLVALALITLAVRGARWASLVSRKLGWFGGAAAIAVAAVAVHASGILRRVPAATSGREMAAVPEPAGHRAARSAPSPIPLSASDPQPVLVAAAAPLAPALPPRKTLRTPARSATRSAAPAPGDTLGEQAERLDRARARLESGDANGAVASLDEYDRRFADGVLAEESALLRIEALRRRGDRDAASALARRFLGTYPASVHVGRVTALLHALSP